MKSAYELAMERLNKEAGPSAKLTDEQKARIAEIDNKCDADVAAVKLEYESKMAAAASAEELQQLRRELNEAAASLQEKAQRAKDQIWEEAGGSTSG